MSLIIWAIHSVTLETDQWQHESTDWDVSIWMISDIMDPLTSGFSPRHVGWDGSERRQGNLREEHFAKSFTTSPLISWSRNAPDPSFILLIFSSILHTHAHMHAFLLPSCYTKGGSDRSPAGSSLVVAGTAGIGQCDKSQNLSKNLRANSQRSKFGILT